MLKRKEIVIKKADLKLYSYLFITFLFLITVGIRAVKGEIDFEFYVDSETYLEFLDEKYTFKEIAIIFPNMLGPTLVLTVFNASFYLVYFFNVFIVLFFYFTLGNLFNLNRNVLLFFMIISPIMFGSIIAINKEIIGLLSLAFFFRYYKNRSFTSLILSILISFLVRWQMALFIFALTFLLSPINLFRMRRGVTLGVFLIAVSVFYGLNQAAFDAFNTIAALGAEESNEGSGLFNTLLNIQNSSLLGYAIVFIPKTLFLYIGLLARYYKFFDFTDFYNNVVVFLQSLVHLLVLIAVIWKKIKLNNVFLFSAVVYCIVFVISPIYAPRYLFPAYILLALALAQNASEFKKFAAKEVVEN